MKRNPIQIINRANVLRNWRLHGHRKSAEPSGAGHDQVHNNDLPFLGNTIDKVELFAVRRLAMGILDRHNILRLVGLVGLPNDLAGRQVSGQGGAGVLPFVGRSLLRFSPDSLGLAGRYFREGAISGLFGAS